MPSIPSALRSGLRRAAFGSAAGLVRADPSGQGEPQFHRLLIGRLKGSPARLQSLAWHAEERGDLVLALRAWLAMVPHADAPARKGIATAPKIFGKLAAIETRMRRQVMLFAPEAVPSPGNAPHIAPQGARVRSQASPSRRTLRMQAVMLSEFRAAVEAMTDAHQARLCKASAALASHRNRARRQHVALAALQPILARWPDYQTAYPLFYKALLQMVQDDPDAPDGWAMLEGWWAFFTARHEKLDDRTMGRIWALSLRFANQLQSVGHMQAGERLIMPAFESWEDNAAALVVLARAAEARSDWRIAAGHWQLYAAITNPVSTKSGTIRAENAAERARKTNFARTSLRAVRAELALECRTAGRQREFRELAARIVESLPDQRLMKYDARILEVTRLYVQDALAEDGAGPLLTAPAAAPAPLRRVVVCLDILKLSEVHTHSRVIFTMCRNMLRHDRDLRMDIVVTNERFAVTTPIVSPSFNPTRASDIETRAREAMGDLFGARFHLHLLAGGGLEGVVDSCKHIIDLAPDLVLYGGGHRGLFSNESRLARHALFDHLPAAFFYIQANNEVDPRFDMIIARGPHAIEGEPGDVPVRIQPYPTIIEEALAAAQTAVDPAKAESKTIVSAITGVRMDVLLKEMTGEEADTFLSILDRVPGAVWHFIGCKDVAAVQKANPALARRVKAGQVRLHTVMPFEEFTALVSGAALFLHLPGFTGGSGGASVARRGAVPILTFNHSDVSGRQPPETIFDEGNAAGFADMAVRLLDDRTEWQRIAERQIAHTDWIRRTSVEGFHACLTEAADLGRTRLTGAAAPAAQAVRGAR